MRARGLGEQRVERPGSSFSYTEETPVDMRRGGRAGAKLSLSEKIKIVHQAVVMKYLHKDIAKEHRISRPYVTLIVRKALRNPKFIAELVSQRDKS